MHAMIDWRKARGGMKSREGGSRTTVFEIPILSPFPHAYPQQTALGQFSPV